GSLPLERYRQLAPAFNAALVQADCTTIERVAMFSAQVGHESGGLQWMQEIADGSAYEGRRDLGNTQPGDGRRFRGHGPIQITGRDNHTQVSEWAYGLGLVPSLTYFVDHPDELGGDEYGFLGVVWYWTVARNMNAYADTRDIQGATRAVNGGLNGLQDRITRFNRCLALGDALLPTHDDDQEFDMAGEARDVQAQLRGPELGGWPTRRYHETDQNRSRFSLVDYAREIDAKTSSKLNLDGRPVDPALADDLFGHVLSLRAEVLALTALVKKLGGK
ncbi:glycoside hydrolase family 19 protein, partial [Rhodococcus jostii]